MQYQQKVDNHPVTGNSGISNGLSVAAQKVKDVPWGLEDLGFILHGSANILKVALKDLE